METTLVFRLKIRLFLTKAWPLQVLLLLLAKWVWTHLLKLPHSLSSSLFVNDVIRIEEILSNSFATVFFLVPR